jgi:hypothetical protein
MRASIRKFFERNRLPAKAMNVAMIELLGGCSVCGRRLLDAGNVRDGVTTIRVIDDETGEEVAAYVVCEECAPCRAK